MTEYSKKQGVYEQIEDCTKRLEEKSVQVGRPIDDFLQVPICPQVDVMRHSN